jgi:hypothetical protein
VDIDELAAQRPGNIEEALDAMRKGLHYYHEKNDRRAIFLRLYYMMTLEVYSAIHGCRAYKGRRIFMDADWIYRLSGKFSTLYFESLVTPEGDRAWQIAHSVAKQPGSSVVQNALLGINAHINFDLPRAIAANLDPAELPDYEIMQKRKFDHDQVNNLLVRTVNPVQRVLAKNYEPGIAVVDRVLGGFDERACGWLLRTYREQVWWNALSFAAAKPGIEQTIVRNKLEWESNHLAKSLRRSRMWGAERTVNRAARVLIRRDWAAIPLERRCHDHRDDPRPIDRPLGEIGCSAPGA